MKLAFISGHFSGHSPAQSPQQCIAMTMSEYELHELRSTSVWPLLLPPPLSLAANRITSYNLSISCLQFNHLGLNWNGLRGNMQRKKIFAPLSTCLWNDVRISWEKNTTSYSIWPQNATAPHRKLRPSVALSRKFTSASFAENIPSLSRCRSSVSQASACFNRYRNNCCVVTV